MVLITESYRLCSKGVCLIAVFLSENKFVFPYIVEIAHKLHMLLK